MPRSDVLMAPNRRGRTAPGVRRPPRLTPWPRRPRPEHPAPVRQIANAIGQWVDRLGAVWVEGQVTQISRAAGHEHRLPDPARHGRRHLGAGHLLRAALRLAATRRWSRAPASSCTPSRRSTPTAARCRCAAARDPDGRARRAAGPARAPPPAARRRGSLRRRAQATAAVPARAASGWSPRRLRRRARRARERPPALAGGALRGARTPPCRACSAAARGHRGASSGSTATPRST